MSIKTAFVFHFLRQIQISLTFEHPGVKAPGTANKTTFLFALNAARFTLLAGESSNTSTLGILSPTYKMSK